MAKSKAELTRSHLVRIFWKAYHGWLQTLKAATRSFFCFVVMLPLELQMATSKQVSEQIIYVNTARTCTHFQASVLNSETQTATCRKQEWGTGTGTEAAKS
jgi:hypothetical protein